MASLRQWAAGDVAQEPLEQVYQEVPRRHLEFSDGVAEDFQGVHKADAVRVELVCSAA